MAEFGGIEEVDWYTPERMSELHAELKPGEEALFAIAGNVAALGMYQEPQAAVPGALVLTGIRLLSHGHRRAGLFGNKGAKPVFTKYDLAWVENTARSKSDARIVRLLFRTDGGSPASKSGVQVAVSSEAVRDQALPYFGDLLKPLVSAHRGYQ